MARNLRETRDALDRQVEQERKMNEALHSLAAPGRPAGAAGGRRRARVRRRSRAEQPAAGDSGHRRAARASAGDVGGSARGDLVAEDAERARPRDHPQPVPLQQPAVRAAVSRSICGTSIAEVVQLRRRDLDTSGIVLDLETTSSRKVHANFTELEQVTLNFVINAQQSIESSRAERGRILDPRRDAGRRVRLEVLDNGAGVIRRDEPKLFQPFFTTKPVGKGTGLGLSVSYGIIDSYGGTIGYRRNEWGGATFFFELPRRAANPATRAMTERLYYTRSV